MEARQIEQAFGEFTGKRIMIIGDVMIDAYLWGRVERISPEAPIPIVSITEREDRLGGASNVALNVAALGAVPLLCAVIGRDTYGGKFKALLKKRGMSPAGILESDKRKTTMKNRIISSNQHLLRIDEEQSEPLDAQTQDRFCQHVVDMIKEEKPDAIIFEDYDKGVLTPKTIEKTIAAAREAQVPVLVDPKKRNFFAYKYVDLFKPNLKELAEGMKLELGRKETDKIAKAAAELRSTMKARHVMITLSEQGVLINDEQGYKHLPAVVRDIADVSGAGDTVISVAALCMSVGMGMNEIAAISNIAGGLVCEKVGVVPIDKALLLNECIEIMT